MKYFLLKILSHVGVLPFTRKEISIEKLFTPITLHCKNYQIKTKILPFSNCGKWPQKEFQQSQKNRIFVSEIMHENSKTNILKYLKFVQQVLAKSILGNEPFSLKYLYEYEGTHIITELQGLFLTFLILKLKTQQFQTQ